MTHDTPGRAGIMTFVRLDVTVGLASLLSLAPGLASAFECTPIDDAPYASIRWNERVLPYSIEAPGSRTMETGAARDAIIRGFEAWSAPDCTDLSFEFSGVVMPAGTSSETNRVAFVDIDWPHDASAVGLTTMTYSVMSGEIRYGLMEFNEASFLFRDSTKDCGTPGARVYDLEAVVTHEAGHFIGLAHVGSGASAADSADPTMSPVVQECDPSFRSLEEDDIAGVCFVYPRGAASRGCPDLPNQPDGYVDNRSFGCSSTHGAPPGSAWSLLVVLVLGLLGRKRACSQVLAG